MFKFLFGGKKQQIQEIKEDLSALEKDILECKEVLNTPNESVSAKKSDKNILNYFLESSNTFKKWYTALKSDNDKDKILCKIKEFGIPEFKFNDIFIYHDKYTELQCNYYTIHEEHRYNFAVSRIEPPVFRLLKDFNERYYDWSYTVVSKCDYAKPIEIIKNVNHSAYHDGMELFIQKNGVTLRATWVVTCFTDSYTNGIIEYEGVNIKLTQNELDILLKVYFHHYYNILREEALIIKQKEYEVRLKLDEAISKAI